MFHYTCRNPAIIFFVSLFAVCGVAASQKLRSIDSFLIRWSDAYRPQPNRHQSEPTFQNRLSDAALSRPTFRVRYDGKYVRIPYPNGDVPANMGVCSDEIIRIYRAVGIDLQQLIHEDMKKRFASYPGLWGLTNPDSNIDHRRVPNLMVFFKTFGTTLSTDSNPELYRGGDVVVWRLSNGLLHIGMAVNKLSQDGKRPMIVHNIGLGPQLEDALYVGTIVAHFRYGP